MARAESLDLLADIIDRLGAVQAASRGAPLRSDDWNSLVGAVTSLARLVASREDTLEEQLEDGYAPADHDHRGRATLAWFEPDTRQLLENAANGSVEQRLGQKRIENDLGAIRAEMKALRDEFESLRRRVDQVREADFARERSLVRVETDIANLRGVESGLDNLSDRLVNLDDSIATVLGFRDDLTSGGASVNLAALQARVDGLEDLRTNLTTETGEIVRIRDLTAAITRLETSQTDTSDIDRLIAGRLANSTILSDAGVISDVAAQVAATIDPRLTAAETGLAELRGDLTALDSTVAPLDARITRVDAALSAQTSRIDAVAAFGPRLDRAETRLTAAETGLAATAGIGGRIDALDLTVSRLGGRVDGHDTRFAGITGTLGVVDSLDARVNAVESATSVLPDLSTRLTGLENRTAVIGVLDNRLTAVESGNNVLGTRLDVAEAELSVLDGAGARISAVESQASALQRWQTGADRQIALLGSGSNAALDARIGALEESLADQQVAITTLDGQVRPLTLANVGTTSRSGFFGFGR